MFIAELFYSIQGEGGLVGVPSVFVRTSGCNLRCFWCDTPYTSWQPEGEHMSVADVLEYVRRYSTGYTVVTGGEPMIAPDIVTLTRGLRELGQHVTIETAGTVYQPVACDLMSISPKLANATPPEEPWKTRHEQTRAQPEVLRRLVREFDYQLKFVVVGPEDLDELDRMVAELGVGRGKVMLMPEGTTEPEMRERSGWLAEVCKQRGYRFSPRLHLLLYGNRRGT
jgi:7-carboxy-7-deazaguanine synthase